MKAAIFSFLEAIGFEESCIVDSNERTCSRKFDRTGMLDYLMDFVQTTSRLRMFSIDRALSIL